VAGIEESSSDTKKAGRKAAKEQARQMNPGDTTPVVQQVARGYGQSVGMQQGTPRICSGT
jgi:hypothetical protein